MKCDSVEMESAEVPDRKQEITSAAMQQLCQGDGWGEEGRSRAGGWGLHLSSINTIVLCLSHFSLLPLLPPLLEFLIVMHHCQHKYSGLDQADKLMKTIQQKY